MATDGAFQAGRFDVVRPAHQLRLLVLPLPLLRLVADLAIAVRTATAARFTLFRRRCSAAALFSCPPLEARSPWRQDGWRSVEDVVTARRPGRAAWPTCCSSIGSTAGQSPCHASHVTRMAFMIGVHSARCHGPSGTRSGSAATPSTRLARSAVKAEPLSVRKESGAPNSPTTRSDVPVALTWYRQLEHVE